MAKNALPLLLLAGGAAVVVLASKKKRPKKSKAGPDSPDEYVGREVVKVVKSGQVLSTMKNPGGYISDTVSWRLVEFKDHDTGGGYHGIFFYNTDYDEWEDGTMRDADGSFVDFLTIDAGRIGDRYTKVSEPEAIAWADGVIESVRSREFAIIGSGLWPQ